ncbi:MAG: sigma-70 family RNA polymerase sigma factor [bacterium]|nr:sigma-70 family RNA polymerase sigma factor [bacterium]
MEDTPRTITTTALLENLFEREDAHAWEEYHRRLRPILIRSAHRMGFSGDDAADVAQETLMRVVAAGRRGDYERGKGRLQAWIQTILRNIAIDRLRKMEPARNARGESILDQLPTPEETEKIWREEVRMRIHSEALRLLRSRGSMHDTTLRAFEMIALEGRDVREVADELGLEPNAVYIAKHRCLTRLTEHVDELTELYELMA